MDTTNNTLLPTITYPAVLPYYILDKIIITAFHSIALIMPKKNNNNEDVILLPSTFIPSSFDVICAQEKEAKNHSGSIHYRTLITDALDQYSKATSKVEKSQIVTDIVDTVTTKSNAAGDDSEGIIGGGSGGFIKKD